MILTKREVSANARLYFNGKFDERVSFEGCFLYMIDLQISLHIHILISKVSSWYSCPMKLLILCHCPLKFIAKITP